MTTSSNDVPRASVTSTLGAALLRELRAMRREIEAYPDDRTPWATPPGIANPAGTLALHLAGNLRHFMGATYGGTGYVRDRDAEFARRDVPRAQIVAELDAAITEAAAGIARLDDGRLDEPFPHVMGKVALTLREALVHLTTHAAYHLGQVDYHRRIVGGDGATVGTIAGHELVEGARGVGAETAVMLASSPATPTRA
jgi:hypothetical protein